MDLVKLMYKYINRIITSHELLVELKNIDLSDYSDDEKEEIKKMIIDIENIKNTVDNEIDEIEKKRLQGIDNLLKNFSTARDNEKIDDQSKEFISKQYNKLLQEKNAFVMEVNYTKKYMEC